MKKLFLFVLLGMFLVTETTLAGPTVHRSGVTIMPPLQITHTTKILSSDLDILVTDNPVLWVDCNGTDRLGNLPAAANSTGLTFTIKNVSDGAGEDFTVKNDVGTTLIILDPDQGVDVSCNGILWKTHTKVSAATTLVRGTSERATHAEAIAGVAVAPHVTPANLVARETGTDIDRGGYHDISLQNIPDLVSGGPVYNFLDNSNDRITTGQDLITGWGAFSVVALAKSTGLADNSSPYAVLASHGTGRGGLHATDPTANTMHFRVFYDAGHFRETYVTFDTSSDQDWHTWVGTVETTGIGGNGYLYLYKDGKLVSTWMHNPIAALHAGSTTFNIGGDGAGASWGGEVARVLVFNIGLTEPWVKTFSSGVSVPFKWNKNATDKPGDVRNSGSFAVGAAYRILTRTDGNFTDAGAANNNVGTEFIATASASGVLDGGDTATRLGAVGVWEQDGVRETLWVDRSGNNFNGLVSGAAVVNLLLDMYLVALPGADHVSEGPRTNDIAAGESVTVMDCVYLHSDGEWHKTDADNVTTAEGMLAISLESKTDGQAMNVAFPGSFVRDASWSWTVGQEIYLDTVTAGGLSQTAPSGTDDVVRIVGHATHANRIFFRPEQTIVVHN